MQIIVVGGGKVGYYLSKTLLEHGHRPHIIEKDRALCTRIADDLDVAVICGAARLMCWKAPAQRMRTR